MIPILEIQGYLALILGVVILIVRIYSCSKLYDKEFLKEILIMAILTSLLWMSYCWYKSKKALMLQFIVMFIGYVGVLTYLYMKK